MRVTEKLSTDVVIIGAGPGGALLADLLARQGLSVVLVERTLTPERSFRGETISARSVSILRDFGHGTALKAHGFLDVGGIAFYEEGRRILAADYARFPVGILPIDIPQPALLNAFVTSASVAPGFVFLSGASFDSFIEEAGVIHGAVIKDRDDKKTEITARLVVGADGRFSETRKASGLAATITPLQRDFLWFKLPRPADWGSESQLVVRRDKHLVILPTFPDLLRVGYNLPKGGFAEVRTRGIDVFKNDIIALDARLEDLINSHINNWQDVSFLNIFTAELTRWARDGFLLIGDAAHTVTPILGQGVNLAIQDAICFAPVIYEAVKSGQTTISASTLNATVEVRRKHKAMIMRFQRAQEASLAQHTSLGTALRRLRLSLLHHSPIKYRQLDRVMNAPHDLQNGAEYRSMLARLIPNEVPSVAGTSYVGAA